MFPFAAKCLQASFQGEGTIIRCYLPTLGGRSTACLRRGVSNDFPLDFLAYLAFCRMSSARRRRLAFFWANTEHSGFTLYYLLLPQSTLLDLSIAAICILFTHSTLCRITHSIAFHCSPAALPRSQRKTLDTRSSTKLHTLTIALYCRDSSDFLQQTARHLPILSSSSSRTHTTALAPCLPQQCLAGRQYAELSLSTLPLPLLPTPLLSHQSTLQPIHLHRHPCRLSALLMRLH